MSHKYRKTGQFLMPAVKPASDPDRYDVYPSFHIEDGKIFRGLQSLAGIIANEPLVIIDGFEGVFFDEIKSEINSILQEKNIHPIWINSADFLKSEKEIDRLIYPFMGGEDPLFGTRCDFQLKDFFDLSGTKESLNEPHLIIYGIGSAIFSEKGFLVYFDLPKNELQFRSRAGTVKNLGAAPAGDPKSMYKRFYFIDWVVLGSHKQEILKRIDILADGQRNGDITWISGKDFRLALKKMSFGPLRARPWFEPGTWGGQWIKDKIPRLNRDVPNYAWSFELITPENGLLLESSGILLEFSFDFLMFAHADSILGSAFERFGNDFPIRFDFLDTFEGGNLSIQVHPRPGYMKNNFGEDFTQEETYYILDAKADATVYLGFREEIDAVRFRNTFEKSQKDNIPVAIEEFIQIHKSKKHDLFLIPYGTIHGSGKNNFVLEISSTPYIFTFKMYDWLRPDLDGKPRPLNINRGMENLYFDRKGEKVSEELICKPVLSEQGHGWQKYHLPTHKTHLYDIYRYHFRGTITIPTDNRCHVLSLVEGTKITVTTVPGSKKNYSYAETFIVPAAAGSYRVVNETDREAVLIIAFVK